VIRGYHIPEYQASAQEREFYNLSLGIPHSRKLHSKGITNMQECFVVIDRTYSGDSLFHGVYDKLADAVVVANLNLGSDILKCTFYGVYKQLLGKPKRFKIIQRLALDPNARMLKEQHIHSVLAEVTSYAAALAWIKDYCAATYSAPDDVRIHESKDSIKAEVYTQKLQIRPNGESYMLGGFFLGDISTEITEYDYCENAITTNSSSS
jgi:hypothetical protein